jgi:F0F1-type ATP synthase membrane subunit b/b'
MTEIRRVLQAAAWRLWAIHALRTFIITLSGAIVALMLALLAQRIFGLKIEWPGDWARLAGAALGLAAVLAAGWSFITRPKELRVARELDERADLRESLSTALVYAKSKDPWAQAVVETARAKAVGVRVKQAIPIAGPRFWPVPLALVLSLYVLYLTVPTLDVFGALKKRQQEELAQQQVQQVKAEVQKDQEQLKKLLEKAKIDVKDDEAAKEGAEQQQPQNPEQIRRTALKKLTSLQDKLNEQKNGEKAKALESLKEQMRQLKQPGPGPLDNLTKNLQKGDFQKARKDLEELQKQMADGNLSKEDQQKAQKQMEKLGDQLKQLAENKKEMEQKLEQAGMSKEQAQKSAKSPEELKKALEELKNLSEEEKQELMKRAMAQMSACKNCSNMGEAMSQAAQAMAKSGGMSQEAQEAMEKMAGQLSDAEMQQADMEATDAAMDEAMKQLSKLGGQCKGGKPGNCDGQGGDPGYSDCQGPWKAGESAGKFGKGSGGPGVSGGGMSPQGEDAPAVTEKKFAGSKQTQGPIIGVRMVQGDQVKGEAQAEFSQAVESSSKAATEAIVEQQVPRELQNAVKGYFGRLESKAKAQQAGAGAPKDHAEPAKK